MSEREQTFERELKFPCGDLDALRSRLIELEAERVAPSSFERTWSSIQSASVAPCTKSLTM